MINFIIVIIIKEKHKRTNKIIRRISRYLTLRSYVVDPIRVSGGAVVTFSGGQQISGPQFGDDFRGHHFAGVRSNQFYDENSVLRGQCVCGRCTIGRSIVQRVARVLAFIIQSRNRIFAHNTLVC